jgi:hypothetical protein
MGDGFGTFGVDTSPDKARLGTLTAIFFLGAGVTGMLDSMAGFWIKVSSLAGARWG